MVERGGGITDLSRGDGGIEGLERSVGEVERIRIR